ncbi:MAG: hypothetical protein DRP78_00170 [Candidatus Omnitrophota bacterium]|nr:MAG: hypothetical protein DRP78_00170 [Candidatus Omnitrophota bacterium]
MAVSGVTALDINQMIETNLVNDRAVIKLIENKQASYVQAKEDWSQIRNEFLDVKTSLIDLKSSVTFYSRKAVSSDTDVVTVKGNNNAAITSYQLTNIVLAEAAQKLSVNALTLNSGTCTSHQSTSAVGSSVDANVLLNDSGNNITNYSSIVSGSFRINNSTIFVNPETDTLYEILSKINSSGAGVIAAFDSATDTISITNDDVGSSGITFASDTANFLSVMNIDTAAATQTGHSDDLNQEISWVQANNPGTRLDTIQDGYFNINGITFEVDISEHSLQDILYAINDSQAGVSAYYNENLDKVVLSAKETGKNIELSNDTSNFLTQVLGNTTNASFSSGSLDINGETVSVESNTFTLNDVEFTLHDALSTGNVTVNVNRDTDFAKDAILDFVDKYNIVYDDLKDKSAVGGTLHGERIIPTIENKLRTYIVSDVSNIGEYSFLRDIGIEYSNGKLSLNASTLDDAFNANADSVGYLFGFDTDGDGLNNDGGFSNTFITDVISPLTLNATGDISERIDYTDTRIEYVKKDLARMQGIMETKEENLWVEYTALATSLAKMGAMYQTWINQLNTMNNSVFNLFSSTNSSNNSSLF